MQCSIIILCLMFIIGNAACMDIDGQTDRNIEFPLLPSLGRDDRNIELALLSSPSRNGSCISLPGAADPSAVLKKLKNIITSPTTKEAFKKFAQQCPPVHEICARRIYLQRSILSCLDEAQQRKMLKHTQALVSVSICCIKNLRKACDETQWTVDVSTSAGLYVVKFPHIEDIASYTTPEANLCNLISNYPDFFIAHAQRIVKHERCDSCTVIEEHNDSGLPCGRLCAFL